MLHTPCFVWLHSVVDVSKSGRALAIASLGKPAIVGNRITWQASYCRPNKAGAEGTDECLASLLQVRLLSDMRAVENPSKEQLDAFAACVQGIANGMGWTG